MIGPLFAGRDLVVVQVFVLESWASLPARRRRKQGRPPALEIHLAP